jgi:hypothetical protein
MNIYGYEDYPKAYKNYNTQYPDAETIGWIWYDTVLYTSAATLALTLFNAVRATPDLSNMEVAGQLAAPKAFLVRAIRFYVKQRPESTATAAAGAAQTGAISNIALLCNTGFLSLIIGAKEYGQFPLWTLQSGGGAYGGLTVNNVLIAGGAADAGNNGFPDSRNILTLTKPLFIAPQINFQVNLTWPAALTLTRNTNITVALDGDLIRPVQ